MKVYADSADVDVVTSLLRDGMVSGVTTNPTILHRSGHDSGSIPELYRRFLEADAQEIFFQATGATEQAMNESAAAISRLGERVVVKVPATAIGFRVGAELVREGTHVLITAVYSLAQSVMAAAIGASYIAPYFGRLNDAGFDALDCIEKMHRSLDGSTTRVLVASIRTPEVAASLTLAGIRHFTAHPSVLEAMLHDPISDSAAAEFEAIASMTA